MKYLTLVAILASAAAVSTAAIPVHPANAVAAREDQNQPQNVVGKTFHLDTNNVKSYIVVFKNSAALQAIDDVAQQILNLGGKIGHRYTSVLKGFSAMIPASLVNTLSSNPLISYIEEDSQVSAFPVSAASIPAHFAKAIVAREDQNQPQNVVSKTDHLDTANVKSYIVVFKDSAAHKVIEDVVQNVLKLGGEVIHRYDSVLKGFSARIPASLVDTLSQNPFISYIEEDGEVSGF
ncbi:hypothetical protein BGZ46_010454 [Entomortierella lignicola]|nr:hypothetical protein BGZ46_010454 [Entomortierella lignicola]